MNIFVGNIAFTATADDLRELFERFGIVDPLLEEFNKLKHTLIFYHDEAFEKKVKELEKTFDEEADLKRFEDIIDEVRKQIELKTMPFDRLQTIFNSLK